MNITRWVAFAAVALTIASGCGGGESEAKSEDKVPIKIAVAAATPVFGQPYIAQAQGYWEDEGIDVELIDNSGSNTLNMVASGQADLGMIGAPAPLLLAVQGKDSKIIYSPQGGPGGGMLVAGPNVGSVEDLKGGRIGSLGKGTSMFGHATIYNDKFNLDADIIPFQTNAALAGALQAGRVDAATGPFDTFAEMIESQKAKILVDTRDKVEREKLLGQDYPEGAVFGLTETLESKRADIVKVLAGFDRALEDFQTMSPENLAKVLSSEKVFATIPMGDLATYVKSATNYVGLNDGYVLEDSWKYTVSRYVTWGLPDLDPDSPTLSFDKRVDMSFLDEARSKN